MGPKAKPPIGAIIDPVLGKPIGMVQIVGCRCRCGFEWIPKVQIVVKCPRCGSYEWHQPKREAVKRLKPPAGKRTMAVANSITAAARRDAIAKAIAACKAAPGNYLKIGDVYPPTPLMTQVIRRERAELRTACQNGELRKAGVEVSFDRRTPTDPRGTYRFRVPATQ